MEELNDIFGGELYALPFALDDTSGLAPHPHGHEHGHDDNHNKQHDDEGVGAPHGDEPHGVDDLAPLESLWEANEGADEFELSFLGAEAFAPAQPDPHAARWGTNELPPREELQRQAARFASLATAMTLEAYVRASTPPRDAPTPPPPGSPAPAPHRHTSNNSSSSSSSNGEGVRSSPCLRPASPSHSSEERVSQSDNSPVPPRARRKSSGKARRKPSSNHNNHAAAALPPATSSAAAKRKLPCPPSGPTPAPAPCPPFPAVVRANENASQCQGYNRKKHAQCQNPALMDYIGPRPEFCAEHIHLDPDALYGKCGVPSGEHNKPCKEVVLKEFQCCHKHFDAILQRDFVGRGALERTKHKKQRAQAICEQIEREAEAARINCERCLYQRKMKLLPKYRALVGVLAEHQRLLERR